MIFRLATRSLATRPLRSLVLSIGFGLGIAVMAELLGVGEVILEQAHSPALAGGGDVIVIGAVGTLDSARYLLSTVLRSDRFRSRVTVASPSKSGTLYLIKGGTRLAVSVRGGIPSREKAIGDPEVAGQRAWIDMPSDERWINPSAGDLLSAMDRFHPVPPTETAGASAFSRTSWAEWLYFNGRSADGRLRFYLTFLTAGEAAAGKRPLFVRLQLDRGGKTANYSAAAPIDQRELLERAPDLDAGGNRVRLDDSGAYRITLALAGESRTGGAHPQSAIRNPQSAIEGTITLEPAPGRSLPPAAIHGARGWVSGYVVPVLAGAFHGTLRVDGEDVSVEGAAGYHDHNWGFWEGVRWQWGQVQSGDLSILYGRVFPPETIADRDRIPGFLGVLGPDGPIGFSTDVSIHEDTAAGAPRTLTVSARGRQLDMTLRLDVGESVATRMALTRDASGAMQFLQLGGVYRVTGRVAGRDINFTARGSAETFRTNP